MNRLISLFAGGVVFAGAILFAAVPASASSTYCVRGSSTSSGRCYTVSPVTKHTKVVDAVPLVNNSSKTATMHCSFSTSITKSITVGIEVSETVKAGLFGLVDAETTIKVSGSVSQSASSATEAGGSIVLKSHQSVTCERTYGYVTTTVTANEWHGLTGSTTKFKMNVPSSLGVTLVD